ncbi:MAG: hypothetical protein ACXVAG_13510 [Vulcanimicrobiaceae bacterium]
MLVPLDEESRARLVRVAVFLCGSALLLAPLAGRGSMEIAQEQAAFGAGLATPQLPASASNPDVWVERDPFAPALQSPIEPLSSGLVPPANTGASGTLLPTTEAGITVRAIVTGATSRALIDDGMQTRIVGTGDWVRGSKIVRIDRDGITLANGLSLMLQTSSLP